MTNFFDSLSVCFDMNEKIAYCISKCSKFDEVSYDHLKEALCHDMCCCEFYAQPSGPSQRRQKQKCLDSKVDILKAVCDIHPGIRFNKNGKPYQPGDGTKGSNLPDITVGSPEKPTAVIEIKFKGDRVRNGQMKRYRTIAEAELLKMVDCFCGASKEREEAFKKAVESKRLELVDPPIEDASSDFDFLFGGPIKKALVWGGGKVVVPILKKLVPIL